MTGSDGRLCNQIIRAFAASFIAKQRNIKFNYGNYYDKMVRLGINLFTSGTMTYKGLQIIKDTDIMMLLQQNIIFKRNIDVNPAYFQTREFSNYLYNHFRSSTNQRPIVSANKFKDRYAVNKDVFVHVRLTDVAHLNQGEAYYHKILSQLTYDNGYIASDDINHPLCRSLIAKYKLIPVTHDEVETIMFGSTCKNIILTGGSFSYIIGLFGFFSDVFYLKGNGSWYPPELFHIPAWHEVSP